MGERKEKNTESSNIPVQNSNDHQSDDEDCDPIPRRKMVYNGSMKKTGPSALQLEQLQQEQQQQQQQHSHVDRNHENETKTIEQIKYPQLFLAASKTERKIPTSVSSKKENRTRRMKRPKNRSRSSSSKSNIHDRMLFIKKEDPPVGPPTGEPNSWDVDCHDDEERSSKGKKSPTNNIRITLTMSTRAKIDPPVESSAEETKILEPAPEGAKRVSMREATTNATATTTPSTMKKETRRQKRRRRIKERNDGRKENHHHLNSILIKRRNPIQTAIENFAFDTTTRRQQRRNYKKKEKDDIQNAIAESLMTISTTASAPVANEEDLDTAMALSLSLRENSAHKNYAFNDNNCMVENFEYTSSTYSSATTSTAIHHRRRLGGGVELAFPSDIGQEETKEEIS